VSAWRVVDAFDEHAPAVLAGRRIDDLRVVAIDESSFARPFRYQSVLFDPVRRCPVEMVPDRQRESVAELLNRLDPAVRAGIETVVIDMWRPFRDAVRDVLGNEVRIVVDRFHVQRAIDGAAQKVRTRFSYRQPPLRADGRAQSRFSHRRYDPRAFNARFAFATRHRRLDQRRRSQLDELFAAFPTIGVAWLMKEAFAGIYDAADRDDAETRLNTWVHNLEAADLPELHALWRAIRRWRTEILAYFDDRQTNAFAEGFTNRIKVMKRRGYGYRNPDRYRARVLLCTTPRAT
jgi:transposase